jgi:glycosyltransferase involved in cell wall biosynthesis
VLGVSFIIPALNEEQYIGSVLDSIIHNAVLFQYEIIVVDNGSSDRTAEIAGDRGALVILEPGKTISALRNIGCSKAKYEIIVFIDGDVILDEAWGANASMSIDTVSRDPMLVTGSFCGLRKNANWIERCWYRPVLSKQIVNYINSGHLIVNRTLFERIGGFREELETGEDYDFCQKARSVGANIVNNDKLAVLHEGYPRTLFHFFRRERWHGKGDYSSLRTVYSSKPAMLSLLFIAVLLITLTFALLHGRVSYLYAPLFVLASISAIASMKRCKGFPLYLPACFALYGLYFLARSASYFDVVIGRLMKKYKGCRSKIMQRQPPPEG